MHKFGFASLLLSALLCGPGCSQETVEKAEEATTAAGEAIESGVKDAAENIGEAAGDVEQAIEGEQTIEEAPSDDAAEVPPADETLDSEPAGETVE